MKQAGTLRKITSHTGGGYFLSSGKDQGGVIVVHDPAQRGGNGSEEFLELEVSYQRIRDIEEQKAAVPLLLQLFLVRDYFLRAQVVIDRQSHFRDCLLEQLHFGFFIADILFAPESDGA